MKLDIFFQALTEKRKGEQMLKLQDNYNEILKMFLVE